MELALEAAKSGRARTALVVLVDGLGRSDQTYAGDLSEAKINSLLGGLVKAKQKLANL